MPREQAIRVLPPAERQQGYNCETFILDLSDYEKGIAGMTTKELQAIWDDMVSMGRTRLPYPFVYVIVKLVGKDDGEEFIRSGFYKQKNERPDELMTSPVLFDEEDTVISYEEVQKVKAHAADGHPLLRPLAEEYDRCLANMGFEYLFFIRLLLIMLNTQNTEKHDMSRKKVTISAVPSEKKRWGKARYTYLCPPDFGGGNGEHRKHNSPRPHLRRGHFKMVAHGAGRVERKQVWIDPCFVMGVPDEPRAAYI